MYTSILLRLITLFLIGAQDNNFDTIIIICIIIIVCVCVCLSHIYYTSYVHLSYMFPNIYVSYIIYDTCMYDCELNIRQVVELSFSQLERRLLRSKGKGLE